MANEIVSRQEWLTARRRLLSKDKAHTQARAHNYDCAYNRGIEELNGAFGYFDLLPEDRASLPW